MSEPKVHVMMPIWNGSDPTGWLGDFTPEKADDTVMQEPMTCVEAQDQAACQELVPLPLPGTQNVPGVGLMGSIERRIDGVTREAFMEEAKDWQSGIERLPSLEVDAVREIVFNMDMTIDRNRVLEDEVAMQVAYYRLFANLERISYFYDLANRHEDLLKAAYASIQQAARNLFKGGTDRDRDANGEFIVSDIRKRLVEVHSLLECLKERKELFRYGSSMLNAFLWQKRSAKMNYTDYSAGAAHAFNAGQEEEPDSGMPPSVRRRAFSQRLAPQVKTAQWDEDELVDREVAVE